LFKKGGDLVRVVTYFEIGLYLCLILLLVFELEFLFNPSESFMKSIAFCPLEQLHGDFEIPMLIHMFELNRMKAVVETPANAERVAVHSISETNFGRPHLVLEID